MNKVNGVYFNTNNNQYFLDTKSSEIFPMSERQKKIVENFYSITEEELYFILNRQYDSKEDYIKEYEYIKSLISKGFFYSKIDNIIPSFRDEVKKSTTSQLILVLTEKCNLRCKYCIYSDKYYKASNYSNNVMTLDVAKKSIDYYIEIHKTKIEYGLNERLQINFYGGEPLLEFDLIKEIVSYVKNTGYDALFYITTNGYLLNNESIEFLVDNRFNITFSLDGYKENHDRNRVTSNNNKTFDVIMSNIMDFYSYKAKVNIDDYNGGLVSFNCCYDYETDLEKSIDFFAENLLGYSKSFVIYSQIDPYNTTYYDISGKQNLAESTLAKSLERVKMRFFSDECSKGFRESAYLLFTGMFSMYARNKNRESIFKGTCVPYSKLAIYPDGVITLCEKTGKRFPLGNINSGGVEEKKLDELVNSFFKNYIEGECKDCSFQNLCSACFVQMNDDYTINSTFCENQKKSIVSTLSELYSLLETQPEMVKLIDASLDERVVRMEL